MKPVINLIFNHRYYLDAPSPFVYRALERSLVTVGFKVNTIFENVIESRVEVYDENSITLFVDCYMQSFDRLTADKIMKSIRGKIGFMGFDDEYMFKWTLFFIKYLDFNITFDRVTHEYVRSLGICSMCIPHPFLTEATQIKENGPVDYEYDVSFVGAVSKAKPKRKKFIQDISRKFPNSYFPGLDGDFLSESEMHKVFRSSKVNLNFTGITDIVLDEGLPWQRDRYGFKGRPFEVGLSHGFCLSEYSPGLDHTLSDTKGIVFFYTLEQCIRLIDFYLSNPEIRMAHAGNLHLYCSKFISASSKDNIFGNALMSLLRQFPKNAMEVRLVDRDLVDKDHMSISFERERSVIMLKNLNFRGFLSNFLQIFSISPPKSFLVFILTFQSALRFGFRMLRFPK